MGNRGPKPKAKVKIRWSPHFAYGIGLLASDGCLSPDGRHISLVSKDKDQIVNFMKALGIQNSIGKNGTGIWRVQFGDVLFYRFLLSIGFTPNKSKTLGLIKVPSKYFFDFLRGVFDGDGCTYSYWDKRWRSSFMFYVCFASASPRFIQWMQNTIDARLGVRGHVTKTEGYSTYQLKYGKHDGLEVLRLMYASRNATCLHRKRLKIEQMLRIVGERL